MPRAEDDNVIQGNRAEACRSGVHFIRAYVVRVDVQADQLVIELRALKQGQPLGRVKRDATESR